MKNVFLLCFLFSVTLQVFSQATHIHPYQENEGGLFLDKIVEINDLKIEDFRSKTKIWLAQTFVDAKSVIEVDETSSIIASGTSRSSAGKMNDAFDQYYKLSYQLNFYFKDGKARFVIDQIKWNFHSQKDGGSDYADIYGLYYTKKNKARTGNIKMKNNFAGQIGKLLTEWSKAMEGKTAASNYNDF